MSWGYLSGLLRSEEVHVLTQNQLLTLIESADADSLTKQLEDTVYGELFQGRSLKEFSKIFDEYFQQKFNEIKSMIPDQTVLNVHAFKIDLNNLKLCYKAKALNKTVDWEALSEEGTIPPERMFTIVDQGLYNELPSIVATTLIELEQDSQMNLRRIDFLIDKAYYNYRLLALKDAMDENPDSYKELVDFYRKEIDCENIKNFFRSFKMGLDKQQIADILISGGHISSDFFIDQANISIDDVADLVLSTPYGEYLNKGITEWAETKSCTLLEKEIDEYLFDQVSNFSYVSAGPAVIEKSLRLLNLELKNLKLIIIGKLNGMSIEEIKGRVRDVR